MPTSASQWLPFKLRYLLWFTLFWASVLSTSDALAQTLLWLPVDATPSSALFYILSGFSWLYWCHRHQQLAIMPVCMAVAGSSTLLLHWNTALFVFFLHLGWLILWYHLAQGEVWWMRGPWLIMFWSDEKINAFIDDEMHGL